MNIQTVKHNDLTFYNVHTPQELEIKFLRNTFGFSELQLEDFVNKTRIPQVETAKDYTLVSLDIPYFETPQETKRSLENGKDKTPIIGAINQALPLPPFASPRTSKRIRASQIYFFISKEYVVVIHERYLPQIDYIFEQCQKTLKNRQEYMAEGSIFLFYRIVDALVDSSLALTNHITATIDSIDKALAAEKTPDHVVEDISVTRRNLVVFQTMIKPALAIFGDLEKAKYTQFGTNMTPFWANILDHLQKVWDRLEDNSELIEGISRSYESMLTVKTNEIIKLLTMFTAILLPLTLVASLYGMNIHLPFGDHPQAFFLLSGFMLLLAVIMLLYFSFKRWL